MEWRPLHASGCCGGNGAPSRHASTALLFLRIQRPNCISGAEGRGVLRRGSEDWSAGGCGVCRELVPPIQPGPSRANRGVGVGVGADHPVLQIGGCPCFILFQPVIEEGELLLGNRQLCVGGWNQGICLVLPFFF